MPAKPHLRLDSDPNFDAPKEIRMKSKLTLFSAIASIALCLVAATASAQCGGLDKGLHPSLHPQSWLQPDSTDGSLILVSERDDVDPIVGFWHLTFSIPNPGGGDPIVIDNALAQWHSDGTEIMNSSRPPITSNFCLGTWQKTGPSRYKLNHFALSSDENSKLVGPANIRESVRLSHDGNSFTGTFSIDQYDTQGNSLAHVEGQVTGNRITVDTQVGSVL